MYTTGILWWLGSFLLSANWVLGVAALGISISCVARVGEEEALMVEEFGDEYRAYMEHTGRFVPPMNAPADVFGPVIEGATP